MHLHDREEGRHRSTRQDRSIMIRRRMSMNDVPLAENMPAFYNVGSEFSINVRLEANITSRLRVEDQHRQRWGKSAKPEAARGGAVGTI